MHHLSLPPEAVRATRAAVKKHRRPDGTFDQGAIARELGLSRPSATHRVERLMAGHYGKAPDFPAPVPKPPKPAKPGRADAPAVEPAVKPEPSDPLDLRRLNDRHSASKAQVKRLEAEVLDLRATLADVKGLLGTPPMPSLILPDRATSSEGGRRAVVLMLSDIQHGELVRLDEMDGLNRFDANLSRVRVGRFFSTAADLLTTHWNGRPPAEIVLACLGDNISGHLHEELMATDDLVVPHQVKDVGQMIAGGVCHLARTVGVPIRVFSIPGNHGRDTHKPWAKRRAASSWDLLATDFAEMAVQGAGVGGVQWHKSASPDAYFSVFDWRFLANHGDTMGGRGGGTGFIGPSATIVKGHRKLVDVSNRTRRPVNYCLTGHYHTTVKTPFGFANGSVAGYNEYARDLRADPEVAQQNMITVHAAKGVIRFDQIYLGAPDEGSMYEGPSGTARPLAALPEGAA